MNFCSTTLSARPSNTHSFPSCMTTWFIAPCPPPLPLLLTIRSWQDLTHLVTWGLIRTSYLPSSVETMDSDCLFIEDTISKDVSINTIFFSPHLWIKECLKRSQRSQFDFLHIQWSLAFRGLSLRSLNYLRKPHQWTLEFFADLFKDFRNLKHKIREFDSSLERSTKIAPELEQAFVPYTMLYNGMKQKKETAPYNSVFCRKD
jgi:hypothetical protein